jgi:hypothetical protein
MRVRRNADAGNEPVSDYTGARWWNRLWEWMAACDMLQHPDRNGNIAARYNLSSPPPT